VTEIDASLNNFQEKYLGVKAVKVTNTLGRIIKMGELVFITPWFGNALEDIAIAGSGYIGIDHEREIATEQITITDTFVVGAVAYFLSGGAGAQGTLEDSAGSGAVAIGTITAFGGSAGAHTYLQFKPYLQKADLAGLDTRVTALEAVPTIYGGKPFVKVATFTAAAAATGVPIVAAADVPAGKKIYLTNFLLSVGGATAWTDSTGTVVKLQDTNGTPVVAASIAKAQLTANAQLGMLTSGVTLGTEVRTGVGLTAAKGLSIIADSDFDAGSTITVTASGFIA